MSVTAPEGAQVWRPAAGVRAAHVAVGAALVAGTVWLAVTGALRPKDEIVFGTADLLALVLLPVVVLRWRMVLDGDLLSLVFLRARRIEVGDIVAARCAAGEGLTFVLADGTTESFQALGNTAWGHRREAPTRADLAARAVLTAAAHARGEPPPVDYRLPPMRGFRKAAARGAVWGLIASLFLGD